MDRLSALPRGGFPFLRGCEAKPIYHVLKYGVPFRDLGADYYNSFNREHKIRGYLKRLQALGWTPDSTPVSA